MESVSILVLELSFHPILISISIRYGSVPLSLISFQDARSPWISFAQVAIPERVAKILTFPDRVTPHNIEILRSAVRNGTDVHPGANFIIQGGGQQFKKFLKFGDRTVTAEKLRIGDIVERHLRDDE